MKKPALGGGHEFRDGGSLSQLELICSPGMPNRDTEKGRQYHERTKHSSWSIRNNPHFLDWPNQPVPFKTYTGLKTIALPQGSEHSTMPALAAVSANTGSGDAAAADRIPTLAELARILHYTGGITRRRKYAGGEILFRAAACTGALYEIELYVVCADLEELPSGVYHWSPKDSSLRRLRDGDHRGILRKATAEEPAVVSASVAIICTATYWRNSWKYQSRAYRHFGWDNGTLLANLFALSAAQGIPATLVQGFADRAVNRLLDVDTAKEVSFSIVALGGSSRPVPHGPSDLPRLGYRVEPLSKTEVDYPLMREMHEYSSLADSSEVAAWRGAPPSKEVQEPIRSLIPLRPLLADRLSPEPIEKVIQRRGSSRQFGRAPISFEELSTILERATRGVSADFLDPFGSQLNDLYLIVNAVRGLAPGSYFFDRAQRALELLREGDFRDQAGYLGLEQRLPADASVAIFYLADLKAIFGRFGNRGYRAVQTEAGIIGGKVYLSAYAQRLGATGLTFHDDDVVKFFSPHAERKSAIFLTAVGRSVRSRN